MNILFQTQLIDFDNTPGPVERKIEISFPMNLESAEIVLKGFTLNYEPNHKNEEHEEHVACVQIGDVLIDGNKVCGTISAATPKDAKVIKREAKIAVIGITSN